jgi:raffinose/stachyose/melibiose transport system substrate-binding protein
MKLYRFSALLLALVLMLALPGLAPVRAQDVVTVTWWTESGQFLDHVQQTFVKAFNDSHKNIKLELVGQEQINDVLRTAFQAGEAPDILQTPGASFIAEYIGAGLIQPLTTYAEKGGWKDKLLPWAYESGIIEGKLYSIPLTYESMVMFYNKSLFDENGWKPPTSLEELNALAEKITAAGKHVFSYGNAEWKPSDEHLMSIYLNNYAGPENVYKALIGDKPWTDPEFAEATELLKVHMVDKGWYSGGVDKYYAYTGPDMMGELVNGEGAMMITGTWMFNAMKEYFTADVKSTWDWAPIPMFKKDLGDYIYLLATGSTLSINGKSKNVDAAAEVLNFLLSDPKLALANAAGSAFGEWVVPLRYAEADFPKDTDPRVVRFFTDFAKTTGAGRYGYTTWTFWPAKADVQLYKDVEIVWAGEMTVKEYLEKHQAEWDAARKEGSTLPIPKR